MAVEIGWEIAENSPAVIQHYRQQALAAGYVGDSILNSVSDTVTMMSAGFLFASRVPGRYVVAIAAVFDFHGGHDPRQSHAQRDQPDRTVHWAPIEAIHGWQAGAAR